VRRTGVWPTSASGAARDQFELFARDFLELLGMKTIIGPDRGPDAGRDLVMEERRVGVAGEKSKRHDIVLHLNPTMIELPAKKPSGRL
jgi:hypothetical protein